MHMARTMKTPSDRTLNRLIRGSILVLVIGIPVFGVVYVMDRWVTPGPTLVERRTQELEAAVKKDPTNVNARLQLVGAYVAGKRDPDALTQLNEVLKAQPNNKTALLARGDLYDRQGNLPAAKNDYQAIVDLMKGQEFAAQDNELESALLGLAQIAITQARPADAIAPLNTALQMDAANADTLNLLGAAYLATGDPKKAVENLRKAVAFVPTDWCDPYVTLAQAYTKLGDAPEAAWATGMVDFCQKQPDKAKQELAALVGGTAAADAYLGLGMIAEVQADAPAAADAYRRVLGLDPGNFNAQAGLARVNAALGSPGDSTSPTPSTPPGTAPAAGGNG
jgi:tetratricopeptide (TPR) repeat protein